MEENQGDPKRTDPIPWNPLTSSEYTYISIEELYNQAV